MLLTIPNSIGESDIEKYMSEKEHPVSEKYERDVFEVILAEASQLKIVETVYVR